MRHRPSGQTSDDPYGDGRAAFWSGKPIWTNPQIGTIAERWRSGWKTAEREYEALAQIRDLPLTDALREQLRPGDVKVIKRVVQTKRSAGQRAAQTFNRKKRHMREEGEW